MTDEQRQALIHHHMYGTCEGIDYPGLNAFTVQFHPEACAGPKDTGFLFDRFIQMMGGARIAAE